VDHPLESPNELLELLARLSDHFDERPEGELDWEDDAA
jgi:hypothetical protein